MKIALITDTHFGARNDNQIIESYMNKFYEEVFFPYVEKNSIDTIIHLGDLVDRRKSISYLSLKNMQDNFIDVIEQKGIETHIIIGNHDCYFRNTNSVNSVNELYKTSSNIKVYEYAETVRFGDFGVCMVPWITRENQEHTLEEVKNTDASVLMGHIEVNGFTMHGNTVCEHGLSKNIFKNFEYVFSGHFHVKNDNGQIYYLGTPYELMWTDSGLDKGFHVFDTENRELEFIQNPNRLFHKVWYDDKGVETIDDVMEDFSQYKDCYIKIIVANKNNPFFFEKYLERLERANPANVTILDSDPIWDDYDEELIDEAEDTLTILEKYVEGIEMEIDKYKLNSVLKGIYLEATEIE